MIKSFFNKLDYVIGAEYYLTREKLNSIFKINSSNFIVEERVDLNSIGFNTNSGNYVVFKLIKRDTDTYTALIDLSKKINIPVENIVFLGLKDKYATTSQYIFIKKELINTSELIDYSRDNYRLIFHGYVSSKPRKNILLGNYFKIIVENISEREYSVLKNILTKIEQYGLPSYYGYQRFGTKRFNTHILGKYLVLNRIDLFLHEFLHSIYPCEDMDSVLKRINCRFESFIYENIIYKNRNIFEALKFINRVTRNLFIDAYASYLYNLLLNNIIDRHGWSFLNNKYPTIGCIDYFNNYYREIAIVESIPKNSLNCFKCWFRNGLFKPENLLINKLRNNSVLIEFSLKPGFYATIVLRELFKDNLVLC